MLRHHLLALLGLDLRRWLLSEPGGRGLEGDAESLLRRKLLQNCLTVALALAGLAQTGGVAGADGYLPVLPGSRPHHRAGGEILPDVVQEPTRPGWTLGLARTLDSGPFLQDGLHDCPRLTLNLGGLANSAREVDFEVSGGTFLGRGPSENSRAGAGH